MREYTLSHLFLRGRSRAPRVITMPVAVALVALLSACSGGRGDGATAQDTTAVNRDLSMATTDSVLPALQDVPVAEAPVPEPQVAPPVAAPRPTPRPAPRPAARRPQSPAPAPAAPAAPATAAEPAQATPAASDGVIAEGSTLRFSSTVRLCTSDRKVGERFTARLLDGASGTNGVTLPSGAIGTFEIATAKRAQNQSDDTYLTVRLLSVAMNGDSYTVQSNTMSASTERVRAATRESDARKVAGGAIIGAVAGQLLGKDTKSTVIGAAAGAAAGTAAAVATADYDTCLANGAVITVVTTAPLTIKRGR